MRPRFITFEGGEGAGKSTQIAWLAASFERAGIAIAQTREPGGSAGGEVIRKLVVEGAVDSWDPTTEALLFMTARYDHLHTLIKPALARGEWVLCDRFYDSTYVYQGIGKQVGEAWLNQLYSLLYGNDAPDITILLDIAPSDGLKRAKSRAGNETRFENMELAFHESVRQGFLARAKAEPARFIVCDATQSAEAVHAKILEKLNARFNLRLTVGARA